MAKMMGKSETVSKAKEKARIELEAMLDVYTNRYEEAIGNKKMTISMIEEFITEAKEESERIIKKLVTEAVSESEWVEKKKYAHDAEQS